ncbi:MAG: hypothetical protein KAT37_00970 [Candidatus Aenigmarchaeota archaeon]|nr:hypothetical protein [Candidatus Aenigmarchaeota archaeon]
MKPKFCPACGKETDVLFNGLCESCFGKKNKLAEIPEKIKIKVCSDCGKIEGARIRKFDEKEVEKIIMKNIKTNGKIKDIKITERNDIVKIEVSGLMEGKIEKKEILETKIMIKKRLCEVCGKVRGGYYEAVLQIRSGDKKKIENSLNILKNIISKKGVITKIEQNKNGVDIYFTPKKILKYVLKSLPKTKEIKRSYTLVTKKDGRDLYRNTVLVRL